MAKSLLITACRPSCPLMPTPTCAAWIMATSLAPSPMAKVRLPLRRTSVVMSAFCLGATRQQMTERHSMAMERNSALRSGSASTGPSAPPTMTIAAPASCSSGFSSRRSVWHAWSAWKTRVAGSCSSSSRSISSSNMRLLSRPVADPIFFAVSFLSPVRIHTLRFAFMSCSSVSGTPSCSLSSTAVDPNTSRSLSISSASLALIASRSLRSAVLASIHAAFHASYSFAGMVRLARMSVRNPADANSVASAKVFCANGLSVARMRCKITSSAPLQYRV
mmetsp:Transcript_6500/g.11221  ORF Transcript_6500/g.11221 Transcript_6500/m.11221 type:complete len:277 (+) Transcript_6500:835-1665(+)